MAWDAGGVRCPRRRGSDLVTANIGAVPDDNMDLGSRARWGYGR